MSAPLQSVSRRTALTALAAGAVALPLGASPALADGQHRPGRPAAKLAPPSAPFTPDVPHGVSADCVLAAYATSPTDPTDYGNYDLAQRTADDISFIVVHDTEETYDGTIRTFQDPARKAAIHYVIREDGHVTQMVRVQDVAWHAGNWTFNGASIGIELIGVAEDPSHFTEAQFSALAKMLRHLSSRYDVPLDRAHVVAHEDIPGTSAAGMAKMHWDPGAYYDWDRLFTLARAEKPSSRRVKAPSTVTVAPTYSSNLLAFTSCNEGAPKLPARPSSAVMLRTSPADDAPLVADPALATAGNAGSDRICDWGTQAAWGQTFAVADRRDGWTGVWCGGTTAWIREDRKSVV